MIYSVIVIIYRVLLVQLEQDSAGVKKRSKPSLNSAIDFFDLLRRSHSFTQVLVVWKRLKVFRESPRLISFSISMSMLRFFQLDNSCSNDCLLKLLIRCSSSDSAAQSERVMYRSIPKPPMPPPPGKPPGI